MSAERWPVRHPGIGILYYDSEQEARIAAGTAGEMLPPTEGVTWATGPANAFRNDPVPDSKTLHPTKTRLALLNAIAAGEVTGYPYYESDHVDYYWDDRPGHQFYVTKRVEELIRAGWVTPPPGGERRPDFRVELTAVGRKVLEEADRGA